ncbi:DUF1349 domain-containing protein [Microbacterium testaceum]|uniref:DUF1349 domain-containing protein n=1 Tax=Microbacterium testaceum TaxID=2033 RepID=UPI003415BE48
MLTRVRASERPRVARVGNVLAFHAHAGDGWSFVRAFTLPGVADALTIGFEMQSPTRDGGHVVFDDIAFEPGTVGDLRSGDLAAARDYYRALRRSPTVPRSEPRAR